MGGTSALFDVGGLQYAPTGDGRERGVRFLSFIEKMYFQELTYWTLHQIHARQTLYIPRLQSLRRDETGP